MRKVQYTENLKLSQIEDESLPWWYGTLNEDNRKIDEAANDISDKVDEIDAELNTEETGLVAKVNELDNEINNEETGISAKVNELDEQLNDEETGIEKAITDIENYLTLGQRTTLTSDDITVVSGAVAFGQWGQGSVSAFPNYRLNNTKKLGMIFGNFAISGFAQNGGRVVLGLGFKVNNSSGSDYNIGAIAGMAVQNGSSNSWIPISATYFTIKANGDVQFSFVVGNSGGQYDLKFWLPPCLMMFD